MRQGVKHLSNVEVLPSGKFIISQTTFSGYFNKAELQDVQVDSSEDVEIFAKEIAPTLGITIRFAGEEPKDNVTRQYNETMKKILPRYGIEFCEIPRKEISAESIIESSVREALETGDFDKIKKLVEFCESPSKEISAEPISASSVREALKAGDFDKIKKLVPDSTLRYLRSRQPARINIKLATEEQGDFQILSVSDDKAKVWKPAWFNKDGIGYQIQSHAGKIEIISKATADGKIQLYFMGVDVRYPKDNSKRVPYWIDYTKLTVNGKMIFDKLTPTWHDKPYRYNMDAKAGEEIILQVEWNKY